MLLGVFLIRDAFWVSKQLHMDSAVLFFFSSHKYYHSIYSVLHFAFFTGQRISGVGLFSTVKELP